VTTSNRIETVGRVKITYHSGHSGPVAVQYVTKADFAQLRKQLNTPGATIHVCTQYRLHGVRAKNRKAVKGGKLHLTPAHINSIEFVDPMPVIN
jgi:hypothetical protein